jgi:hypothetical protein
MLTIIDNFLPYDVHENIKNLMIGPDPAFPWYLNNSVVGVNTEMIEGSPIYDCQFVHTLYRDKVTTSSFFDFINIPFSDLLKPLSWIRIKANLNPVTEMCVKHGWHIDIDSIYGEKYDGSRHKTAVYYVNTNNGKTLLKNGEEVDSVANRMVIFNGNQFHTGTTCTDQKVRCVINFNYVV